MISTQVVAERALGHHLLIFTQIAACEGAYDGMLRSVNYNDLVIKWDLLMYMLDKWAAAKGRPPELTWESLTSPGARAIGRGLEAWTNLALTARIMGVCTSFIPAADDFGGLRGWDVLESAARDWSAQWADREKAARFVAEARRLASAEEERSAQFLRDLDALGVGPG